MATRRDLRTAREFGRAIRERRTGLGLTQQAVAQRAHVGRSWLVRLEGGHAGAELAKTLAVARALHLAVTLDESTPDGEPATVIDLDRIIAEVT